MRGLIIAIIILSLCQCARPQSTELFISSKEAIDNKYSFTLALDDTLKCYDISFYTRVDKALKDSLPVSLELQLNWVSPSTKTAHETVYMDLSKSLESYRRGLSPLEAGTWTLEVLINNPPNGFRGLGVVCKENGTR